jgi:REP element-mobilizing transposase RayT
MAYVKNWLHCVWGTKNRVPYLTGRLISDLINHIKINAKEKGIYIDTINGHKEHMHCLISLDPDQTLSKVMQLIKGESSFWINKNKLTKLKFEWAVEYFAVSKSDSHVPKVRGYIKNQAEHHNKKTWEDEYNSFIKEYGFERFPD